MKFSYVKDNAMYVSIHLFKKNVDTSQTFLLHMAEVEKVGVLIKAKYKKVQWKQT